MRITDANGVSIELTKANIEEYRDILMEYHDDARNSHKYYYFHLEQNSNSFNIEYGRIGHKPNKLTYPKMKLWNKLQEKIKKGYKVLRISRHDERGNEFVDFLEKFLNGGEDCWLPE
jgi:predicted DNA-binding WGR domain protein